MLFWWWEKDKYVERDKSLDTWFCIRGCISSLMFLKQVPQTETLKTTEVYYLTGLEYWCLKSGFQQGQAPFEMCRRESFPVSLSFWCLPTILGAPVWSRHRSIIRLIVSCLFLLLVSLCPCGIFLLWHQSCWISAKVASVMPNSLRHYGL